MNSKGFAFVVPLVVVAVLISGAVVYFSFRNGEESNPQTESRTRTAEPASFEQGLNQNSGADVKDVKKEPEGIAAPEKPESKPIVKEPVTFELESKPAAVSSAPKPPQIEPSQKFPTAAELAEFAAWANGYGISLQAISADVDDLYYNRYEPGKHNIALDKIPGLMLVYGALKNIPDSILAVMKDKTIYFSTANVRPYANLTGDYGGTLKNTKPGFILTQPISKEATIHEFGHIVGYHGIEGLYGFAAPFSDLKEEYNALFDTTGISYPPPETPKGFISSYATANRAENFAEHFAYYATRAGDFKTKMAGDDLLTKKYNFFDKKLFLNVWDRKAAQVQEKCQSNPSPVFTNHITDIGKVRYVVPPPTMGAGPSLKPHGYIGTDGQNVPIFAPAAATLKAGAYFADGPYTMELQISCEVTIRFGHITNPVDSIKNLLPKEPQPDSRTQELEPVKFAAGELLGYTTGTKTAGNWDFGVYNSSTSNRYAGDPNWNNSAVYTTAVCPFGYFPPSMKAEYYAKFNPTILGGNPPHGESFCAQ